MRRHYQKTSLYKNVTPEDWNDWKWQMANRITSIEDLEQVLSFSPDERQDINRGLQRLRMSITPYYATLMKPDDPDCPLRRQAVPNILETRIKNS